MSVHTYHPNDLSLIMSCTFDNVDFKSLSQEKIFPPCSKWKDRSLLYSTVQAYAALTGWKPTLSHTHTIKCSCYSRRPRGSKKRMFTAGSLSKGCQWQIKMKSTKNKFVTVTNGKNAGKIVPHPVVDDGVPVILSKCNLEHTGTCNPSPLQQVMQRSRSGAYTRSNSDISDSAFFAICSMYKDNANMSSSVIRQILKSQFPANKNVSKTHVWWMKQCVKLILPKMKHCDNFHDFQHILKSTKIHSDIDNIPLNDDNICQVGKELWEELMNNTNSEDTFFTFREYMSHLEENNDGFAVSFLQDSSGRYTGCIWQTSIMRDNFERFGTYISIDGTKRGLNKLLWPYMSICMYNELNTVCVACEAIICTEREDAYKAMIDFVVENSKRKHEEIFVVVADEFVNSDTVSKKFGLPNAIYMADIWHLLDSILPKKFGTECFNLLNSSLKQMIDSQTKEEFDSSFKVAMNILKSKNDRNLEHETALEEFESQKESYATYILSKKRATRGKHGSSISEMNHSSVLESGNHYCEHPQALVKDLFLRQEKHVTKWNQLIHKEYNDLSLLQAKISKQAEPDLFHASEVLCLSSFRDFQERYRNTSFYIKQVISPLHVKVRSIKYPSAPPRQCYRSDHSLNFTCLACKTTVVNEDQCVHSLVANDNKFLACQFSPRHFRRQFISGAYVSLDPTKKHFSQSTSDDSLSDSSCDHNFDTDNGDEFISDRKVAGTECLLTQVNASHYEQLQQEQSNVKSLTAHELKRNLDTMLGNYNYCSEPVKKKLNTIFLSLNEICASDGIRNGLLHDGAQENYSQIRNGFNHTTLPQQNPFTTTQHFGNNNNSQHVNFAYDFPNRLFYGAF